MQLFKVNFGPQSKRFYILGAELVGQVISRYMTDDHQKLEIHREDPEMFFQTSGLASRTMTISYGGFKITSSVHDFAYLWMFLAEARMNNTRFHEWMQCYATDYVLCLPVETWEALKALADDHRSEANNMANEDYGV